MRKPLWRLSGRKGLKRDGKNLNLYVRIGIHLLVKRKVVSPGQARACLRAHVEMIIFIGPGLRDLGPTSRVYNASGSDLELADVHSSSPMRAMRAIGHHVEGDPK